MGISELREEIDKLRERQKELELHAGAIRAELEQQRMELAAREEEK